MQLKTSSVLLSITCLRRSGSWIGLNDIAKEGRYVWSDGSVNNYTNWNTGEPNNWWNQSDEDCTVFRVSGTWNDLPCTNRIINKNACKRKLGANPGSSFTRRPAGCIVVCCFVTFSLTFATNTPQSLIGERTSVHVQN